MVRAATTARVNHISAAFFSGIIARVGYLTSLHGLPSSSTLHPASSGYYLIT